MSKEWNFDIATDEMKFKMFKQLVDRNKELRKQLAGKDKELKQKNKTIKRLTRYNDELANALVEKPEQLELYQLREDNKVLSMKRDNYVKAELNEQRHQICEKIRKTSTPLSNYYGEITSYSIRKSQLDDIEKGE